MMKMQLNQIKRWFNEAETEVDIHTLVNDIMTSGHVQISTGNSSGSKLKIKYSPQNSTYVFNENTEDYNRMSIKRYI